MLFYLSIVSTELDKKKMQNIYEKYYGLMIYIASQFFPHRSDAEDIVHDSIVKIIKHLKCVDTEDVVRTKAFCSAIVKHTALDRLKSKEHAVVFLDDFNSELPDQRDFTLSSDTYNDLLSAIRNLDQSNRIVLSLKYVNDLTDKEIAAILDTTEKAVSARLTRCRRKLRKALEEGKNEQTNK